MFHYKCTLPTRVSVLVAIMIVAAIAHSKLRKTFRGSKVKRKPIFIYLELHVFFSNSFFIGISFLYLVVYPLSIHYLEKIHPVLNI